MFVRESVGFDPLCVCESGLTFHSQSELVVLSCIAMCTWWNVLFPGAVLQLSIDASRNVLYSLSEEGTIQVFDLAANGQECTCVSRLTANQLVEYASLCSR